MSFDSKIDVITNASETEALRSIREALDQESIKDFEIDIIHAQVPQRWLLPWMSKKVFLMRAYDRRFTHFHYSEDDILFTEINLRYFLDNVDYLKTYGLYPSFLRVERRVNSPHLVASDFWPEFYRRLDISDQIPIPRGPTGHKYFGLSNPYQAMFFYDRELFQEHIKSPSFDILQYGHLETLNDEWGGGVAERAAYGLTFFNVPSFAKSRNVIAVDDSLSIVDSRSFVHHLPNNYGGRDNVTFVSELIAGSRSA